MPRRDHTASLLIVLLILVFAAGAYLTRFPESPVVQAAEKWPLVGPLATAFRRRFVSRPAVPPASERVAGGSESAAAGRLGTATATEFDVEAIEAHPQLWVPAGAVVREAPEPSGAVVEEMEAITNLSLLERRGDWFRVLVGRRRGWVYLEDYDEPSGDPPLGRAVAPPGPLPGRAPQAELLDAARERFSSPPREVRFGAYRTFTDVEDTELLGLCDRLAASLDEIYGRRYGLELQPGRAAAIFLFRRREDYQTLQAQTRRISGLTASGHVGRGLVAVYQGGRQPVAIAGTLGHELVHLLNRRGLGPALPPWLDEGLADDLGESEIDAAGTVRPGRLGGEAERTDDRIEFSGAGASAIVLRQALEAGQALPLPELIGLDWEGFVVGEGRPLHYAQSSFFIRFLLSGGDPELAAGFRGFLQDVAGGKAVSVEALQHRLGTDWPELEVRLRAWMAQLAGAVEDAAGR